MTIKPLFLACLLVLPPAVSAHAQTDQPPHARAESALDAKFRTLHEREWTWRQEQNGIAGEEDGPPARIALPDVSPAAQAARLKRWESVLRELDAIDPAKLSEANRIHYLVYRPQVENLAAGARFHDYEMPFNADSSFWSSLGFIGQRELRTPRQYRDYIALLREVPRYFDQHMANMRAGLARGFSVPRATLDGRDGSIAQVATLADPGQAALYRPFKRMPATIPTAEQNQLREEARRAIGEAVIPAYGKLLAFFREEYTPKARTTLAAEAMPDGVAWYRQQIRHYTTLELPPEDIHRIGLKEVARIRAEMEAIIEQVGFEGKSKATRFQDFLAFLRTDPRFYATTAQQLLDRAAWISKRVDGEVGKIIGKLPRNRFAIVEVPADIAPFWTAGRGGAGTYWLNTYDLPSRPLYNLPALTLHESSPGHSLQGSLVMEMGEMPGFRKEYISAYGEGWGLYSEWLGKEMGIYQTPYEDFGRLTYAMWRACRLVIDTGVHHKGWTRDQALAYLRDNTALSEHEVTTEVDRYISWPAQALSYKLGELAIMRLRAEAERELGRKFDARRFHDALLAQGALPLPVLENEIRAFIAREKRRD
ncbi:DUF885 family protein [Lysobacter pythonis]|uniref:DUF885 family protein n=1 Tax=Solilutibacter pythonis TaxID=2483112 RepID=A0A3M2I3E0_9GAMM|nr:DUF885 family protein [Lysobacter pythonis]RMH93742.1 DUF885 family protein [Lysobacter pythonis]